MKTINYMVYSQVMRIPNLTLCDKLILSYFIACQKHNGNQPFVRQSNIIADNMQIHQNTIKKTIKQLRESNLIQVDRKDVNYYSINTNELRKHMTQEEFDELNLIDVKVKVEVKDDMSKQLQEVKQELAEITEPVQAPVTTEKEHLKELGKKMQQEMSKRIPPLDAPDAEMFIKSKIPTEKLKEWRRNIHSHDLAISSNASSEIRGTVEWINSAFYKGDKRTVFNINKIIDKLIYECYGTV